MKKIIILIIAVFIINISNAQWQKIGLDNNSPQTITCVDSNIYVGIYPNGVYFSSDNGNTWTAKNNGIPLTTFVVNFLINGNYIFAATPDGLYLSTNYGNSWSLKNTGLMNTYINTLAANGNNIYAGTWGGGIYLSSNNGDTWDTIGLSNNSINNIIIKNNIIYACTGTNGIFSSSNSGNSWDSIFPDLSQYSVNFLIVNDSIMFAGTDCNRILKSTNYGNNWNYLTNGLEGNTIEGILSNDSNVYVSILNTGEFQGCSPYGGFFESTNNGLSFIDFSDGIQYESGRIAKNNKYIYEGNSVGIWRRPLSDFALGIKENNLNNNVSIYPNPTKDNLTIETNTNSEQKIEIKNLIGQTVYTNSIYKKTIVNTSAFANGIYILKLTSDKETVERKFVKD